MGARLRRRRGLLRGDRVAVHMGRTPDLVACLLGVMAAGAAYVPVDPALPEARRDALVEDSGAVAVLDALPARRGAADPAARPSDPAYALYTSGSTGTPKGVLVTHANLHAFATDLAHRTGAGPGTRALAASSVGFDASVIDLLVPLAAGGCVMLAGDADRADPERLAAFIAAHDVDWGFLTPRCSRWSTRTPCRAGRSCSAAATSCPPPSPAAGCAPGSGGSSTSTARPRPPSR
ncbi:AMP-binding protein [Actinokineospora soli]|uniref:AMP-binding protein n=1 Tax=Actinokineospora soli TaxID=1048753 RepID=A0ABW2THU2_9PSEU